MSNLSVRWAFNFNSWKPSHRELVQATTYIQLEEKQRIGKFVFRKDFKSSLIGRLMIRKFLSTVTELPYNEINLIRDEKGKPIFNHASAKNISFNVSHQGDFTVLSGETNGERLGVDVMQIGYSGGKSLSEFFRIMNRQFSATEWTNICDSGTEKQQLTTFCRNWSLKESYVKALGVGITVNLQDISFDIKATNLALDKIVRDTELYLKGVKQDWVFEECLLDDNHCVTTALFKDGANNSSLTDHLFIQLSFDELIAGAKSLSDVDIEYCNAFFKKE